MYDRVIKRLLDIIFSFLMIILMSPIILFISILLFLVYGRKNIFYIQDRPGKNLKIFSLYKFKSMIDNNNQLSDDMRTTYLGKILRRTSMDELPQLYNIIKGDMSLIGPRPLLVEYIPKYTETELKRHDVRPGLTGWAQVNGRNKLLFQERFKADLWYINNISFKTDIKIFFLTIFKVLKSENNYSQDPNKFI